MKILLAINHILLLFTTYTDLRQAQKSTKLLKTKFYPCKKFGYSLSQHRCLTIFMFLPN